MHVLFKMDITASAEHFTTFLLTCASKSPSGRDVFAYEMKGGRENVPMSATVLPPLVHSPLSEFTGPLQCPTVLLASPEQLKDEEEESPDLNAVLDEFSDSVITKDREKGATSDVHHSPDLVQLLKKETIFVGQQLSHKRRYLKEEIEFHPGQTRAVVTHADLSRVQPLSVDRARALVSFYLVGSRKCSVSLPALWVPCTVDKGEESIVGLGCTFDHGRSQLRVYCVRRKEGSGVGQRAGKKGVTSADLRGTAFAEYKIMSSETDSILGPQISIQFVWENPTALLAPPPTLGTEAVLKVAVEPGSLQSLVSMFDEMQTLLRVCEAVGEGGKYFSGESEQVLGELESLADKVGDFFEKINTPLSHTLQVSVISPSIESTVYKPRQNLDFTESLWLFIKDARSAEELQTTLGKIFKSLLLGKTQNIALRESSKSSLAELLRQLIKCKSVAERQSIAPKFQLMLSTPKSLLCLAQIGIEKLKRDLKGFLIGASVANGAEIDSFFEDHVNKSVVGECHCLCNLYHVVELVATLLCHHCFSTLSLAVLTKAAMSFYKQRPFTGFEMSPLFSVALSRNSTVLRPLIDVCVTAPPKLWCVSLQVQSPARMTVFRSAALPPGKNQCDKQCYAYEATCNDVIV